MSAKYRTNASTRLVNAAFSALVRLGLGEDYRYVLTVTGRKTGKPRS